MGSINEESQIDDGEIASFRTEGSNAFEFWFMIDTLLCSILKFDIALLITVTQHLSCQQYFHKDQKRPLLHAS